MISLTSAEVLICPLGRKQMLTLFLRAGKRFLLAVSCFCTVFASLQNSNAAEMKLRVGKATGISFSQVPVDVGLQEGFFKKHELDIELSSFGGGGSLIQALMSDSIDVGIVGTPELSLAAKGA